LYLFSFCYFLGLLIFPWDPIVFLELSFQ
jgi:hypothetical protein